jgi:voltage-gated potassium channel
MSQNRPNDEVQPPLKSRGLKSRIHEIIFGADTFAGALFDVLLLFAIVASIIVVSLESVPGIGRAVGDYEEASYADVLHSLSWAFTVFFTIEYVVRIYCVRKPLKYIFSFWGIIDLLSFLPDYLLFLLSNYFAPEFVYRGSFSVIRALRLLRVFRIFKLGWFENEAQDLGGAVWRSRAKIIVFLTVVMIVVTVMGTLMYEVEHAFGNEDSQFNSIPEGIYWAIVTMTTVGFGDIVPTTIAGKFLSAVLILIGYSLIIVPTGFVSAEILDQRSKSVSTRSCSSCITEGHDVDARYCKYCGQPMSQVVY